MTEFLGNLACIIKALWRCLSERDIYLFMPGLSVNIPCIFINRQKRINIERLICHATFGFMETDLEPNHDHFAERFSCYIHIRLFT